MYAYRKCKTWCSLGIINTIWVQHKTTTVSNMDKLYAILCSAEHKHKWELDKWTDRYMDRLRDGAATAISFSWEVLIKLDESTARRQLKSPRSLSGRSIHLTLVTKWSRSWSWMTYCHTLCAMSIGPPILRYSYFKIWPWKSMVKVMCVVKGQSHVWPSNFKGQDYGQGQTHWSHLRPGVQSICLPFHFMAIEPLLAET